MAKKQVIKNHSRLLKIKIRSLLLPGAIIIAAILLGLFKNQFVAATVNGEQVNRLELVRELESREGKRILENLISERLIMQSAKAKNISVSEEEIDSEIKTIEKNVKDQGQSLDDLLALQGLSQDDIRNEIKIQLLLRKLVGQVEVPNKEIEDYIEQNQESIPDDEDLEKVRDQVKKQLEQDKINQKIQALLDDLRKNAKIEYLLKF